MGNLCPVSLPPIHKTPQPVIMWRRRASQPLGGLIFHFDYSCNNNNHYFMFYNSNQSRNYCTKTRSHLMIPPRRMRFSSSVRTSSECSFLINHRIFLLCRLLSRIALVALLSHSCSSSFKQPTAMYYLGGESQLT